MKRLHCLIFFCILAFLWSCGTKSGVSPTGLSGPAGKLFLEAEEQFQAKSYEKALELYQDYLITYPDKPLAPAAVMKIGAINSILGDFAQARQAYQYLIDEYPGSALVKDAMFEILFTYYQESKFDEVLARAPDVAEYMDSREHIYKIYALIGDTYKAMGSPIDAIEYYLEAQGLATMVEQEAINLKLKEAIAQLDSDDVAILLDSAEERLPVDYLLFQLGLNYTMEEKYGDALTVLNEFIDRYPDHDNVPLAQSLMEEIRKNAIFKRYTLGCLLPLSGPYQKFGYQALKGIELALGDFSSQSENPPVNIIIKDTAGDPEKTRQALHELNEEQVAAIIGPLVTAQTAAQEAQDLGIPIITITQKDGITSIGDNVFRNFITPKMQVEAITQYAMDYLGLTRFAILYPDETYGDTFMNLFWDELIEKGGQVVGVQSYNPEHTDFAHPIKKLVGLYYEIPQELKPELEAYHVNLNYLLNRQEEEDTPSDRQKKKNARDNEEEEPQPIVDFEAIFIPDAPKKAGLIIPQLAFYDVNDVLLMGTNLWHSKSLIKMADKFVQGVIMPDAFYVDSDAWQVSSFVEKFEETYQEKPGFIEAVMYDSAVLLLQIVSKPHIRFRSELRSELYDLVDFQGVTGLTRFDENGDAQKKLHLLTVKGRRFVELK